MPVDELMDFGKLAHTRFGIGVDARDQLELRLAEVGRDVRVRQRGAQRRRMRCRREPAIEATRRLSFSTPRSNAQRVVRQCGEAIP